MEKIKPIFHKRLFWDVVLENIDYHEKKRFVIERVFDRGDLPDIIQARRYYGDETIIQILITAKYLFPETTLFCAGYFDIPIENFKCYKSRQLHLIPSLY